MHQSSMSIMETVLAKIHIQGTVNVLDVGSKSWANHPTYRDILPSPEWKYLGMDVMPGENVDVVAEDPYAWPFEDEHFEVVISGQCIEHAEDLPAWFKELSRVLKPGGVACIIAPWSWSVHQCPKDYWRILPDGMEYLLTHHAGLEVVTTVAFDSNINEAKLAEDVELGDALISKPGVLAEPQLLRDLKIEDGFQIGLVTIQGDCLGVAKKPENGT